jgi:serine/threonine protein kinase
VTRDGVWSIVYYYRISFTEFQVCYTSGKMYAVKLIKGPDYSPVQLDMGLIQALIDQPQPMMGVEYHAWWYDREGTVVVMDEYPANLRRWIVTGQPWFESDWFAVMAGIALRLAAAHFIDIPHGDLKPSNSSFP